MPYNSLFELPSQDDKIWQNQDGRVWIKTSGQDEFGFLGCAMLGGFTQPGPSTTPVWCPDPTQRRKFVKIDEVEAPPGLGSVSISMYLSKMNFLRQLQARGCVYHLDARYGECGDPSAENNWEHILRFCGVRIGDLSSTDLHARDASAEVDITAATTFDQVYDIWKLAAELVATTVVGNIIATKFCDAPSCGECGLTPSAGCNKIYAIAYPAAGATLGVSTDGGNTWTWTLIVAAGWAVGDVPTDLACVGDKVIVTSSLGSLVYTDDEGVTWTRTATGFLALSPGNAIFSSDARHTWIAGKIGTIYFTAEPEDGVTAQTSASLTVANLHDIVFVDSNNGYAVGNNNTFLYTVDGGKTWVAGIGPAAGIDLSNIYAFHSASGKVVIVGTRTGTLWQSFDAGATWTQRLLPGTTGTLNIQAIEGCGCQGLEVFVLVDAGTYLVGTEGQLFRSIDGGITWREIDLPVNSGVLDLSCCSPNRAVVVGEALAGGTGFVATVSG
jgi:photosystem II stability/assembly factor-like uncharacterized protein